MLKIASIISILFFPFIIAFLTIVYVIYTSTNTIEAFITFTGISVFFMIIVPLLYVFVFVVRTKIDSYEIGIRQYREKVYVVGCISVLLSWAVLYGFDAPQKLLILVFSCLVCAFICLVINNFFKLKVSIHITTVGLSAGILYVENQYNLSILLLGTFALVLVGWARWYLKKHTIQEIIIGFLVSLVTIFQIYSLL